MERFWSKVDKSGDCWEWTAGKQKSGYGRFKVNGKQKRAHRYVLELEGVDIPSDMCVCHTCDNPGRVNPDHLWLGTIAENQRDMAEKGRSTLGRRSPLAKLTETDVRWIRQLGASNAKVGKCFGVVNSHISRIRRGQSWSHI